MTGYLLGLLAVILPASLAAFLAFVMGHRKARMSIFHDVCT